MLVDIFIWLIAAGIKACRMIGILKDVEFVDSDDLCWKVDDDVGHHIYSNKEVWFSDGRSTDE